MGFDSSIVASSPVKQVAPLDRSGSPDGMVRSVVLVDANILLYSADLASPLHERADGWLTEALNGTRRVGLPWISLHVRAGLVSDAVLAAICIEHGLDIVSADSDFARFTELGWINPIASTDRGRQR
jgi:predicted nucleic acid-binding protein